MSHCAMQIYFMLNARVPPQYPKGDTLVFLKAALFSQKVSFSPLQSASFIVQKRHFVSVSVIHDVPQCYS